MEESGTQRPTRHQEEKFKEVPLVQMWTLHKPEDCELEKNEVGKDDNRKPTAALAMIDNDEDSVK